MEFDLAKAKMKEITERITGSKDFLDFESKEMIRMMKILVDSPMPVCNLIFKAYENELKKRVKSEGKNICPR